MKKGIKYHGYEHPENGRQNKGIKRKCSKELKPLPGFKPVGNVGKEAPEYFYKMYGLEKI